MAIPLPAAESSSEDATSRAPHVIGSPTQAVAIGMLMARTPCTAPAAREILAAAAHGAGVTVPEMARAVVDRSRGLPLPSGIDRGLRVAVEAARTPATGVLRGLLPGRGRTAEVLNRFRECQARLRRAPGDAAAHTAMDDIAYTLCVLMARRTVHEAVTAAEQHLAAPPRA
ncbi:DUF5133 domain-containing protein [Streptomyces vilmorinianum]|uniref:DUF5133 domain-containing protein n=1 Tax=Streptomyces vilmorinianum TaxID=3051092 RepID=UPI0015864305|nr:DUF5133 domain-containing protein [Streptomyces vilmorinianum]